jgi:hypothetical protein
MSPQEGHKWFTSWLPLAVQAGPFMTLVMAVILVITTWWLAGWLRECADRNRLLGDKLITQQQAFHAEVMLRLAHCPPPH